MFTCPECGKEYTASKSLNYHIRVVHQGHPMRKRPRMFEKNSYPHPCPYTDCSRGYTSQIRLNNHLTIVHFEPVNPHAPIKKRKKSDIAKPYFCPYPDCSCSYLNEKRLQNHLELDHPYVKLEIDLGLDSWQTWTELEF